MMMIYLIDQECGDVNVKNLNVKKTIVNALLGIKNAHLVVDVKIVLTRKKCQYNLRKKWKLKLLPIEYLLYNWTIFVNIKLL